MLNSVRIVSAAAIMLASATHVMAGGFVLLLGNPQASAEAHAQNAAVTLKAAGCGEPQKSAMTATAIGVVDGQRKAVELKVVALREPGMYAVKRGWPSEGQWVLKFVARNGDLTTMTLARVGANGVEYKTAKHHASEADLTAMLSKAPAPQTASR
jgi:hypothetical protein